MASLTRNSRSAFWYVQFTDEKTGKRRCVSTGLRADDEHQTAQARLVRAKLEAKELSAVNTSTLNGWDFVPEFLANRSKNPLTRNRYEKAWEWISLWLSIANLTHPGQIRFRHGQEFAKWRASYKKKSGKHVSINTARLDAKVFSMIMGYANKLELCSGNPLVRMEIPKEDSEEKPELTDDEFAKILPALENEPAWMKVAFHISMHTGCRLRETRIPLDCIDIPRRTILFPAPKGGKKRAFTAPMPEQLVPLFESLRGQAVTLEFPWQPSRQWQHFFRRLEMDHLCFHCLRVTFITRLARRGVPLSMAMRLVNHASSTVHRIYQRLQVEDVRLYALGLVSQTAPVAIPQSQPETQRHSQKETPASVSRRSRYRSRPPMPPPSPSTSPACPPSTSGGTAEH